LAPEVKKEIPTKEEKAPTKEIKPEVKKEIPSKEMKPSEAKAPPEEARPKEKIKPEIKKKAPPKRELNSRQIEILEKLKTLKKITRKQYADMFSISVPTAARDLKNLLNKKLLRARGPLGPGRWYELIEEEGNGST